MRIRKDGTAITVSVTLSPMRDGHGRVTGVAAVARDISARVKIEQDLQTALRDRETLLKEVYHRVKNNLQVVSSLFNLQLNTMPDGVARICLERWERL